MPRRAKRPGLIRRALAGTIRAAASVITTTATWTSASILGAGAGGKHYDALDPTRKLITQLRRLAREQANTILSGSLRDLQGHCRHLERNNPTARACIEGLDGLVVGSGIALRPDTGNRGLDQMIKREFDRWARHCTVDGRNIYALEELLFREVVAVGEGITIDIVDPDLARQGEIPLRILPLDTEWIDDHNMASPPEGATQVSGIGVDKLGRPVNYFLSNPNDINLDGAKAVPASQVTHVFERRRALQLRGEPWFTPVIETLILERELVSVELYAAQQSAAPAYAVTSEDHDDLDEGDEGHLATEDDPAQLIQPGGSWRLLPGEDIKILSHNRPSQQIAPFRQMLRGDVAASMRIPVRFLDRDVSRANYSSMRADMLDQKRLLDPVREWFGHQTIGAYYQKVLPWILIKLGITADVDPNYRLLPDEQPYVDPMKDKISELIGIYGGLDTYEQSISGRGGDYKDTWRQRKQEQDEIESSGLQVGLPSQINLQINLGNNEEAPSEQQTQE